LVTSIALSFDIPQVHADGGVTFRSYGDSGGADSDTCLIPKPAGLEVGDLMITQVFGSGATIETFTAPEGWTGIRQDTYAGSTDFGSALFWKIADSDDVAAANFTFIATGATSNRGAITAWYGHDPITPINAQNGQVNSDFSSTITAPTITPSVASCVIGLFCGAPGQLTQSGYAIVTDNPASWDEAYDLHSNLAMDLSFSLGYATRPETSATGNGMATRIGSTRSTGQLIAIAPLVAGDLPTVTTQSVTLVEETTATGNGNITDTGGENANRRGFAYKVGTSGDPTTADSVAYDDGSFGTGNFAKAITGLTAGESYRVRAYAVNTGGTGYGDTVQMYTKPTDPSALTETGVTNNSIDLSWTKGTGSEKTMIRYSAVGYPADPEDGTQGYFDTASTCTVGSLSPGQLYYFRAWAWDTNAGYSDGYTSDTATTIDPPVVTTQAATSIEAVTATGNGNITDVGIANAFVRGFEWDTNSGTPYSYSVTENGDFSTGNFSLSITGLPTGTTIYCRALATNADGTGYGSEVSFLTKPAAPTNVSATDGAHTDKVVVTWTKSTGATGYRVYEGDNLLDTLGDVATYDDTAASAPTITPGDAVASDGASPDYVTLSVSGESTSNGTSRTYKVGAFNATGSSANSSTDTGFRGVGAITYQWQRSAADSDENYSSISGGTTDPYNDTGAPSDGSGRYFKASVNASGAAQQTTSSNRGYRTIASVVTTQAATNPTGTSVQANGTIVSLSTGGSATTRGFAYFEGDSGDPTTDNSTVYETGAFNTGSYALTISITPDTDYRFRAYIINSLGTTYGDSTDVKMIKALVLRVINADSVQEVSIGAEGLSIPDTSANWTWMANNSAVYADNISISVDGVRQLYYCPNEIIESAAGGLTGILPDREGSNDGTIYWGDLPSNVTLDFGMMESDYEMYLYDEDTTQDIMPAIPGKETSTDAARRVALSTHFLFPFAEAIETITSNHITVVFQFQMGIVALALVLFFLGYFFLGENLAIAGTLSCIPMGYGIAISAYDWWVIAALVLWLAGCVIGENRRIPA